MIFAIAHVQRLDGRRTMDADWHLDQTPTRYAILGRGLDACRYSPTPRMPVSAVMSAKLDHWSFLLTQRSHIEVQSL